MALRCIGAVVIATPGDLCSTWVLTHGSPSCGLSGVSLREKAPFDIGPILAITRMSIR
jgi:hypothetical protein